MSPLFVLVFLATPCVSLWHCGDNFVTNGLSYAVSFGADDANSCCLQHKLAYQLSQFDSYVNWGVRLLADQQLKLCLRRNNAGSYRKLVSSVFYNANRIQNWFCFLIRLC